ncbi:hypothetical protein C4552_04900 [Candidatus Parcubacteria bacterium]|nr:MAG: hypothetical protein C4552_04900 [Candidatus Parcubacteria bacterium]
MLDDLTSLIRNGERYIIVEGGKPRYVLLSFDDYRALVGGAGNSTASAPAVRADLDLANAELQAARQRPSADIPPEALPMAVAAAPDPLSIRLEDLPL